MEGTPIKGRFNIETGLGGEFSDKLVRLNRLYDDVDDEDDSDMVSFVFVDNDGGKCVVLGKLAFPTLLSVVVVCDEVAELGIRFIELAALRGIL